MKCPTCNGDTKVTDSRDYPSEADQETIRARGGRTRWLDIPRADRRNMPPGTKWRRHKCLDCGATASTVEVFLAIAG